MSFNSSVLVCRSLSFHWRSHLGVLLGAAVGTSVLVGALVVGDSVRFSLKQMAMARLGRVQLALPAGERLFRDALAGELAAELNAPAAAVLQLFGSAALPDASARANSVQILGVDESFWALGGEGEAAFALTAGAVFNERLARQLNVNIGDEVRLRILKPSALSRDAPLSNDEEALVRLSVTVKAIAPDNGFGRFSLQANQVPPFNAFVPRAVLQKAVMQPGKANLVLLGESDRALEIGQATAALRKRWQLADAALELREIAPLEMLELRSPRVMLDPPVAKAALQAAPDARGILTYFVNELRHGGKTTPYSMVAAAGAPVVEPDMPDTDIVLTDWLAEDLAAKIGDEIHLTYFVMGPQRTLEEASRSFRVHAIVPLKGPCADKELMPDFPGMKDAPDCRSWQVGFQLDYTRIRDKDEKYWDEYQGAPKAFVTLKAAQDMWRNRFGEYTAVRYPLIDGKKARVATHLLENLLPADVGLGFQPVREQALAASTQAMDFGGLFIGFSFFLIVAALLLMGLLFQFGIERRSGEVGTLLSLGIPMRRVRCYLLAEGMVLAALGGVVGAVGGIVYARAMLHGLSTAWVKAVQTTSLQFHAAPATLCVGVVAGTLVAFVVIALGVRKQAQRPARELLGAGAEWTSSSPQRSRSGWFAAIFFVSAVALVVWAGARRDAMAAGVFFGAGALLLMAGLACTWSVLISLARRSVARVTLTRLGWRNASRRRGRSVATVGLLACGVFLVVAVGANRQNPSDGAELRSSGTGGFALFAQTALPIVQDLNSAVGRDVYNLSKQEMTGVSVVPLRVRAGDDASCLNLNRAQVPQLWGVQPHQLAERNAFTFSAILEEGSFAHHPWELLDVPIDDETIPAIGDMNTVMWGLGQSLGGTLDYVDERGLPFKVRIVATIATSMLQGGLIVQEDALLKRYPSESGYRILLIDVPSGRKDQVAATLSRQLDDMGLEVVPAARRLADFNAVQDTYLTTFQVLGSLGLLLGSLGLGVLVLRNVLERRGELALLRAVGFRKGALRMLVVGEHAALLAGGLCVGVLAATLAVVPALRSPGSGIPYEQLTLTVAAVLVSGLLWTFAAAFVALRGPLLDALREG